MKVVKSGSKTDAICVTNHSDSFPRICEFFLLLFLCGSSRFRSPLVQFPSKIDRTNFTVNPLDVRWIRKRNIQNSWKYEEHTSYYLLDCLERLKSLRDNK